MMVVCFNLNRLIHTTISIFSLLIVLTYFDTFLYGFHLCGVI